MTKWLPYLTFALNVVCSDLVCLQTFLDKCKFVCLCVYVRATFGKNDGKQLARNWTSLSVLAKIFNNSLALAFDLWMFAKHMLLSLNVPERKMERNAVKLDLRQ